jgi:hypothetical protein
MDTHTHIQDAQAADSTMSESATSRRCVWTAMNSAEHMGGVGGVGEVIDVESSGKVLYIVAFYPRAWLYFTCMHACVLSHHINMLYTRE